MENKKGKGCSSFIILFFSALFIAGGFYVKNQLQEFNVARIIFIVGGILFFIFLISLIFSTTKNKKNHNKIDTDEVYEYDQQKEYFEMVDRAIDYYERYHTCKQCGHRLLQSTSSEFKKYDVVFRCSSCGNYEVYSYDYLIDVYQRGR